jgi:hypothetical protein
MRAESVSSIYVRPYDSNKLHRKSGSVLGYSQPSPFDKLRAGSTGLNLER